MITHPQIRKPDQLEKHCARTASFVITVLSKNFQGTSCCLFKGKSDMNVCTFFTEGHKPAGQQQLEEPLTNGPRQRGTSEGQVPLKSGAMFQTLMLPAFMNWPRAISRKKMGIPPTKTISRYGMRKTPAGGDGLEMR